MYPGNQLHAPEGYLNLLPGRTYYYLRSRASGVLFVEFVERVSPHPKRSGKGGKYSAVARTYIPHLVAMPRDVFELGVTGEVIKASDEQSVLPPWLLGLEDLEVAHLDQGRPLSLSPDISHAQRMDRKLEVIWPLVIDEQKILQSKNPDALINRHARSCTPPQNEGRVRLWFYTYLIFRSRKSLMYPIGNLGKWDRHQKQTLKRGRKGADGSSGYNGTPEMIRLAVEAWDEYNEVGREFTEIYRLALVHKYGCKVRDGLNGLKEHYHPQGKPFPKYGAFVYYISQEIGRKAMAEAKLGPGRVKAELSPSVGKFTDSFANLMESVNSDGYFLPELPRGLLDDNPLAPLCVVRKRDLASGAIIGVGFSLGSETASAYRMASFCAAIDKVKFCALFGIQIAPEDWPTIGVLVADLVDRGPGASIKARPTDIGAAPVLSQIAPAGSPKSKATIEASNPKHVRINEQQSYVRSNQSVFALVKKEIRRVVKDNHSINVTSRIPPNLLKHVPVPSPIGLWKELDARGRNDGVTMSFPDAVRAFLPKVPAILKEDGLYVCNQRYDSSELRQTKLFGLSSDRQEVEVEVYHLEAALRYVWFDFEGTLYELEMQLPLRSGNSQKYLSLSELQQREITIRRNVSAFRKHRHAVATEQHEAFREETGQPWHSSTRHKGRAKKGSAGPRKEAAESREQMRGGR